MKHISSLALVLVFTVGMVHSVSAAIYVDNLPLSTSSDDVERLFSPYGKVMKVTVNDKGEGASSMTGLVHMGNFSMEKNAIKELQGKKVNGKTLKLSQAKARAYEHGVLIAEFIY